MATITMHTAFGFTTVTDKRWTPSGAAAGDNPNNAADIAAMTDNDSLDTALAAANGTYWTAARLDQTNIWDKLYWLRVNRQSTSELT